MPLTKITISPQHITSLHPLAWTAEIEGTDHTLAGRKRHVDAATCKELWSLIETAHHDMFPQDAPLMPLEAMLNHVDEGIATEIEKVEALVEEAVMMTEGAVPAPFEEMHELEEPPALEDDGEEHVAHEVHRRGRPRRR